MNYDMETLAIYFMSLSKESDPDVQNEMNS